MRVGLCLKCRFARRLVSARGSTFWRCGRARDEPEFPDYPPLPVTSCRGYEPRPGAGSPERPGSERPSTAKNSSRKR